MVREQRASLVSLRVFAETCPQRTSRYSSAKAYQLMVVAPRPLLTRPKSSAAASLTARTNEAPSSSARALTSTPSPAAGPRRGFITLGPRRPGAFRTWPAELRMTTTASLQLNAPPAAPMPAKKAPPGG